MAKKAKSGGGCGGSAKKAAATLGCHGGKKGGPARAAKLSGARRSEIAAMGARAKGKGGGKKAGGKKFKGFKK